MKKTLASLCSLLFASMAHAQAILPAGEAPQMVRDGALLVDVRSTREFKEGHIKGALHISYDDIEDRISELGSDKSKSVILYCRSGRRSGVALGTLKRIGFTNVYNAGGYTDLKPHFP